MVLMHQNIPVAELEMNNHIPIGYSVIYHADLLPLGTTSNFKLQERLLFKKWVESRCVPNYRINLDIYQQYFNFTITEAFIRSFGISLTDTYWFNPNLDNNLKWEYINFHDNPFDVGLLNYYLHQNQLSFQTPDFTTDGIMEKFWINNCGIPSLIKLDYQHDQQLIANEVVYSNIAASLNIPVTRYHAGCFQNIQYCICPCFVTNSHTDVISAMQLKHDDFSRTGTILLQYLKNTLGFTKEINNMIFLDCFFHNVDRHEKNYGLLKDLNTNQLSFIPLYDNSYCLGVNRDQYHKITDNDIKPFTKTRKEILSTCDIPTNLDSNYCFSELQSIYEYFHVPEYKYQIAKEELKHSFDLLNELSQTYYINNINLSKEQDEILPNL